MEAESVIKMVSKLNCTTKASMELLKYWCTQNLSSSKYIGLQNLFHKTSCGINELSKLVLSKVALNWIWGNKCMNRIFATKNTQNSVAYNIKKLEITKIYPAVESGLNKWWYIYTKEYKRTLSVVLETIYWFGMIFLMSKVKSATWTIAPFLLKKKGKKSSGNQQKAQEIKLPSSW